MSTKTLILTSTYPYELTSPNSNTHHRLRRRITNTLHIVSFLACLTSIALFSAAIPRWNANFFHNTGPSRGDWTDGISLGPLTFALIYHCAVLIYNHVQKRHQRHTSIASLSRRSLLVHTAIPILVMTSLLPCLFVAGYGSLFRFWQPAVRTQSGVLVCNLLNVFARECEPVLYAVGTLQIGGIVFGTLLWIFHFMLILISLRDLRRHRLVKQLQREKLAQYETGRGQRPPSHPQRVGSRSDSTSNASGEHREWHKQPHRQPDPDRSRRHGPKLSSRSNSTADSYKNGLSVDGRHQDVPIFLVQPPEESRAR